MSASRRALLSGGAAAGLGLAVAGAVPSLAEASPAGRHRNRGQHTVRPDGDRSPVARVAKPFPPLVDDPDGILALADGFSYAIVTTAGVTSLDSGEKTPGAHDGNAVFSSRGRYRLIQNHEQGGGATYGVPHLEGTVYDPGALAAGGCTVITTDARGRNLGEFVAISGTVDNCAGGPTPWGSWLTCEETEDRAGTTWEGEDGAATGTYQKDHGYVFEVFQDGRTLPEPIKAFGRFAHEALAIDADRTHVFLSEDADGPNGLFYRWTAPRGYRLRAGIAEQLGDRSGRLEAMRIHLPDGSILPDVAYLTSAQLGLPFRVTWAEVPDRDARTTSTREQFADGEITRGRKFEGVWGTDKGVYVVNSYAWEDGDLPADAVPHDGMVWFYDYEEETISLVTYFPHQLTAETEEAAAYDDLTFDGPDNVTVTPWGSLVLAEDGVGASHVLAAVPYGPAQAIARNMLNDSEFTGPVFSEDGKVLFVNMQDPGYTLAITGPWERYLG
ncbi:alkaline phosphatase PhoX [Nocardioides insulae]|uniref:alkaline phosphatase PhoX n=1 Tax=Nocardioides insulae TaxID=394734 RepID=UPI0003F7E455|nr:alkaline phosphatase PhoX [Nocardioides insulae]